MRISLLTFALSTLAALPAFAQAAPAADDQPAAAAQPVEQPAAEPQASDAAQENQESAAPAQQADQQPNAQEHTAQQDQEDNATHSADPNYRRHNGRWWYWQNGGWLMWNGDRWLTQQERSQRVYSSAPGRSFSYTEDVQGYVPTDAGIPQSTASGLQRSTVAPGTVRYQRILPSYGMRSAGSKALGNY